MCSPGNYGDEESRTKTLKNEKNERKKALPILNKEGRGPGINPKNRKLMKTAGGESLFSKN